MEVKLISHSTNPIDSICIAVANMTSKDPIEHVRCLSLIQKYDMISEILRSRLRGALEFADFHFHVTGVTRAFTHQLVRHRTFSFSQQSLRFFKAAQSGFKIPNVLPQHQRVIEECSQSILHVYEELLIAGCPTEDARSILPHNILTLISFRCTYRGLLDLAEVRLCAQAQEEFREVVLAIKSEVEKIEPFLAQQLVSACERSGHCEFKSVYDRPCPKERR